MKASKTENNLHTKFKSIHNKFSYIISIFLIMICLIYFYSKQEIIQEHHSSTIISSTPNAIHPTIPPFEIDGPLYAFSTYSLCILYNTSGLSKPSILIADVNNHLTSLKIGLPKNSFGLGDACIEISPHYTFTNPTLFFLENGAENSAFRIHQWTLANSTPSLQKLFKYPVLIDKIGDAYLENNFLRLNFILPIVIFLVIWIGAGLIISSCILGLNYTEMLLLSPITGMTFIAFLGYLLSLIGIYNKFSFIFFAILISLTILFYRNYKTNRQELKFNSLSLSPAVNQEKKSFATLFWDVIACLLVLYISYKYLYVAAAPFAGDSWDGLVSWNKWGTDWTSREFRGNYQFTYPQLIPIFYSAFYKLSGYSAENPLGLQMNVVHFFITYMGLLALPLIYACSKALKILPIIPLCVVLLSKQYFFFMNDGLVDNLLITYYLAIGLLILRATTSKEVESNLLSVIGICLIGSGAIFLKQTGIFATASAGLLVLTLYKNKVPYKSMLIWCGLIMVTPFEFYLHELYLDLYPSFVEDNPLNHSIGGLLSNATTQIRLGSNQASWYSAIGNKVAALFGASYEPTKIEANLLVFFILITIYIVTLILLYKSKKWRLFLIWGLCIGGQLVIAGKFGNLGEFRYILLLIPATAFMVGVCIERGLVYIPLFNWLHGTFILTIVILTIGRLSSIYLPVPEARTDGFDTISFDSRHARFFHPSHVKLNEFLLSQTDQNFSFFSESNFVVRPHTIFDSYTKSVPTKMSQIYQSGDYWYTMVSDKCPQGFIQAPLELNYGILCKKY